MPQDLILDIRTDDQGNSFLHFPFMSVSDVHLGTQHCRAKKLSHMLEHTRADAFYLVGDIIDGEHLIQKKKWKFGHPTQSWHRQVVAHVCRMPDRGTKVTYIPGNHDIKIRNQKTIAGPIKKSYRNLCGKIIYGIHIAEQATHSDDLGRKIRLLHGDIYDQTLGAAPLGDALLELMYYADTLFQRIPKCSHISLAAIGKKAVKKTIDRIWKIRERISQDVDEDPNIDGILTGHSHMSEIARTPKNKFILNDGCCTEHVESLVIDKQGTMAIIQWHSAWIKMTYEDGRTQIHAWKDLELDSFNNPATFIEDEGTRKSDRLIRLFYRMWPPKERKQMLKQREFARAAGLVTIGPSMAHIPLPSHHQNRKPKTPSTLPLSPKETLAA